MMEVLRQTTMLIDGDDRNDEDSNHNHGTDSAFVISSDISTSESSLGEMNITQCVFRRYTHTVTGGVVWKKNRKSYNSSTSDS